MRRTRVLTLALAAVTAGGLALVPVTGAQATPPPPGHGRPGPPGGPPHPPAPGPARTIALPTGIQPEGITSVGDRFYVGSLADGRIVTGSLRGGPTTVLLPGAPGRQLRGLFPDERRGLLWAVGNVGTVAHVYAVSLRDGRVAADVPVPGGVFLNDLIVTPSTVWVTDSKVQRLTRIDLDRRGLPARGPAFLTLGGTWPGDLGGNAANGIRELDRTHVVLDHSTAGGLWAVDLCTGRATQIPVRGTQIAGGDGLERAGDTLWVVRGVSDTSVSQLRLRPGPGGWRADYVRTLTDPSLDVPSTATFERGTLYAVNARFGAADPATTRYYITPLR